MKYLQIQGTVFKRGFIGKTCPKYVIKPSILYNSFKTGVQE